MSVDATKWAWSLSISPTRKIVLLSMADRAGESHVCWPSVARLEADTCLDRKTILSAIAGLEELGLIVVRRTLGRGNCYQLLGVESRETSTKNGTGFDAKAVPITAPVPISGPVPKTGPHQSQKRDHHQSQKRDTESINEPKRINQSDFDDQPESKSTATMAGAVCVALKSIGMAKVAPGNLHLKTLIDAGADIGAFVEAGKKAVDRQKGFEYMLAIVQKQLVDCAALGSSLANQGASAGTVNGMLPGAI